MASVTMGIFKTGSKHGDVCTVLPLKPRPDLSILLQPNSVMLVCTVGVSVTFSLVSSSSRFSGAQQMDFSRYAR
jgi:hypothetical protein